MEIQEIIETQRDLALENAISITRQWGILLDDYRYLLQKFTTDCSCHLKFDNTFFLKGMEQRYEALKKMANDNDYLSAFTDDDSDWSSLNNIWENRANKTLELGIETSRLIRRVTVINDDTELIEKSQLNPSNSGSVSTKRSKRQIEKNNTEYDDSIEVDSLNLATKVFKCEVKECNFTTMGNDKYQAHIRYHQGLSGTTIEVDNVLHICQDCGKEFPNEDSLKNHIQNSHVDVRIYSCEVAGCEFSTKFRSCFRDHMIRHTGKKNFHCTWEGCEKSFRTKRDLMAHINFHHHSIRRFACDFPNCGQLFKDSNRLKHHQYIHTGERPYKCKYRDCEARFKQIPHLRKHEKIHINKQIEDDEYDESQDIIIENYDTYVEWTENNEEN